MRNLENTYNSETESLVDDLLEKYIILTKQEEDKD